MWEYNSDNKKAICKGRTSNVVINKVFTFQAELKRMSVLATIKEGSHYCHKVLVKGAP